jgi:hypothetical protein
MWASVVISFREPKRMSSLQIKKMVEKEEQTEEEKVKEKFKQELNPAIPILKSLIIENEHN